MCALCLKLLCSAISVDLNLTEGQPNFSFFFWGENIFHLTTFIGFPYSNICIKESINSLYVLKPQLRRGV